MVVHDLETLSVGNHVPLSNFLGNSHSHFAESCKPDQSERRFLREIRTIGECQFNALKYSTDEGEKWPSSNLCRSGLTGL